MSTPCFIHVDLDAFFASVEQLDNPDYRGKPVIVGSLPTDRRGVVSTCSYEARTYGVHSAMPIGKAAQLCPHAIFLRGRMDRYHEKSKEVMLCFAEFSPDVQQMSIDEAFVDITGTERLFGLPAHVAKKLKQRVFEQTGLTVSVGIAANKYIAKIASGMSKPDGLFTVAPGDEEKFMLSLPLRKIWGIGEKTLARISSAGFLTSQDVHKASLKMLESILGKHTGSFLYHAVRGCEVATFSDSPKTRSISSERTFSFDLTDRYAIDTALMELSWDIMFRLFTEGWNSRTAHLKIRYEDFTTVSVQETSSRILSSADDLYTRAKRLFEKKYIPGNGIRLLGIGAQNLEDKSVPVQLELFDFGEQKKTAVEKTIVEIQKKNPHIHMRKARLIKKLIIIALLLPASFFSFLGNPSATSLFAQTTEAEQETPSNPPVIAPFSATGLPFLPTEAPISIFSFTPDSPEVEFYAEGTWEASLSGSFNISGGSNSGEKVPLDFSITPPIFMQKTDLTVWFLLQDKWYFEAAVADDYDKSTIAAGYYGQNILRHVRIGNRYITFPEIYGVTNAERGVGSGSNQAPGIMAEWQGATWQANALVRYDMIESMERTWQGQNELSEQNIALTHWQKGGRFVFPDGTAELIAAVYVESNKSDTVLYRDAEGRSYEKLSSAEYLIIPSINTLVLANPTNGSVLVDFYSTPDADTVKGKLGSFNPPSLFLGDIQNWFGSAKEATVQKPPVLGNYALGNDSQDFFTTIGSSTNQALILQKPDFFSPFVDASLYAVSSFSDVDHVAVVSKSTGITQKSYGAVIIDKDSLETPGFSDNDFFDEQDTYIELYNRSDVTQEKTDPAKRYPAADTNPLVYLSPATDTSIVQQYGDMVLSVQTASQTSVLEIGTEAVPGSITVYRNGIQETLFRYDSETGIVHLSSPPGTFDTIRMTWQQNNETASSGALTAAVGIEKRFTPNLALNASSSFLWPILEKEAFTDSSFNAAGSVTLALDLDWKKDGMSLENTLFASVETPDVTNARRILGMNSKRPQEINLTSNAAVTMPANFVPKLNKRPDEITPTPPPILTIDKKGTITAEAARDSTQSGYVVKADWEISVGKDWIAQTIDFSGGSGELPSARTFSIWLKDDAIAGLDYEIYLQLGVSADETELFETNGEVPTWHITDTSLDPSTDVKTPFKKGTENWQKVTVYLTDEDRAKFSINQNARLILRLTTAPATDPAKGILFAGPFEIADSSFAVIEPYGSSLRTEEVLAGGTQPAEMQRFNIGTTNTAQYFKWTVAAPTPSTTTTVSAERYIDAIPLASYETLRFFAYMPPMPPMPPTTPTAPDTNITLTLDRETAFGHKTALKLELKPDALEQFENSWQEFVLDLHTKKLYIGGKELSSDDYTLSELDTTIAPTRLEIAFSHATETETGTTAATGELYIDEIHLAGAIWEFVAQNILDFEWQKSGAILSAGNVPVFANPKFTTAIRAGVNTPIAGKDSTNAKTDVGLVTDSRAQIDIFGIQTEASVIFSSSNNTTSTLPNQSAAFVIESASHRIESTPIFFATRIFSFAEEYRYLPQSYGAKKTESFTLSFAPLNVNLNASFRTEALQENNLFSQDIDIQSDYSIQGEKLGYTIQANLTAQQSGYSAATLDTSYFGSWLDISALQFSAGEPYAEKRKTAFALSQSFNIPAISFTPNISIGAENSYTSALDTENAAADILELSFPFTIKDQQFSIQWTKKSFSDGTVIAGGNYTDDAKLYTEWMKNRIWAHKAIPFYDFFDTALPTKMMESVKNQNASSNKPSIDVSGYTSAWTASWNRKIFANPLDIVVPSQASFSISRDIRASAIDVSDSIQFNTHLGFTAFNSFGKFSTTRLFDWYEQDEIIQSLSMTYKTDKTSPQNWRLVFSGYNQTTLFFTNTDKLRTLIEGQIDTDRDWLFKMQAAWERNGTSSFILDGLLFLFPSLNDTQQGFTRSNTFFMSLSQTSTDTSDAKKIFSQTYGITHLIELNITDFVKIGLSLAAELSIRDKLFSLQNTLGISGKLEF